MDACIYLSPLKWMRSSDEDSESEISEQDVVTHSPEQVRDRRNALHAVVKDLHYQSRPVNGENGHF